MNADEGMPSCTILMADDDAEDRFFVTEALKELNCGAQLCLVEDGLELTHFLKRAGKYTDPGIAPRPAMILLDLDMPKKDGRKALCEIKSDAELQQIPLIVWTDCFELDERIQCRKAGAEDFVAKPADFTELMNMIRKLIMQYGS